MVLIVVLAVSLNPLAASISFRWASFLALSSGDFACSRVSPTSCRASGNCSSIFSNNLPTDKSWISEGAPKAFVAAFIGDKTNVSAKPDTTSGSWVTPLAILKAGSARYFLAKEVSYSSSSTSFNSRGA